MALYRIEGLDDQKAQQIGEVVASLGKDFTPHDVIDVARHEDSPLHRYFEWDDSKAAGEYRLQQARSLIQRIRIVVQTSAGEKMKTRAFHNVEVVVANKLVPRYVPLKTVKASRNLTDQVIHEALRELKDWQRKYKEYSEILGTDIFEVIDETITGLKDYLHA